jgi:hypothetical protein
MVTDSDTQSIRAFEAYRARRMSRWHRVTYYECEHCKRIVELYYIFGQNNKVLCINCYGMNQFNGLITGATGATSGDDDSK